MLACIPHFTLEVKVRFTSTLLYHTKGIESEYKFASHPCIPYSKVGIQIKCSCIVEGEEQSRTDSHTTRDFTLKSGVEFKLH